MRSIKGRADRNGFLTRAEFLEAEKRLREDFWKAMGAMEKRMDRRFEASQVEMDRRFDAIDQRFEASRVEMDRRFSEMDMRFEAMKDWVSLNVGRFQVRAGKNLEDTVAGALRLALNMWDIRPEHLTLRRKILDADGRIGPRGREYEIDILARNGESYVFEVKSVCDGREDLDRFDDKAGLAIESLGLSKAHKVLVTLDKNSWLAEECERREILLV